MDNEQLKKIVEKAKSDPEFFHKLIFDTDKLLDPKTIVKPVDIGGIVQECGTSCIDSCSNTCEGSCKGTCASSCDTTCGSRSCVGTTATPNIGDRILPGGKSGFFK